jgi:hypothetical protein
MGAEYSAETEYSVSAEVENSAFCRSLLVSAHLSTESFKLLNCSYFVIIYSFPTTTLAEN